MVLYSIIKKSQLEQAYRLDAEFYQLEYFVDFSKGKWIPIGNILENCQYGISHAMSETIVGPPIFRMDDIKNAFLVNDSVKYINITNKEFQLYRLNKDDILFNRVNSEEFVGRTGIFKLENDFVYASYLIRLKVDERSNISADYLNIFLNSLYGIKQIRKFRRRSVNQANVNAEELKQIRIKQVDQKFQEEIKIISNNSWQQLLLSKSLFSQAEDLLLRELGLKDYKIEEDLTFAVNLSEIKSSHRTDTEFFQPKYKKIFKLLKKVRTDIMQNNFDVIKSKSYQYVKNGNVNVIQTKQLGKFYINLETKENTTKEILEIEKLPLVKENDVLFASMGVGSLGKTNIIYDFEINNLILTIDSTLRIFRKKGNGNILPEVLNIFFSSFIGQELIYKYIVGTSGIISIYENCLDNFPLPILPLVTQQKIADLVKKSHEAHKKSKSLLDEAKRKVEEMIEKGGD